MEGKMCRNMIVFVVFATVIFNVHPSLGLARPNSFLGRIKGNGYNDNKFDHIKDGIIATSNVNGINQNGLHLAHVFPWAGIDACVDEYWNNQNLQLKNLVDTIFKPDNNAVAAKIWTKKTRRNGDNIPNKSSMKKHTSTSYLGQNLKLENTDMLIRAHSVCKKGGKKNECKVLLYNAPANLRFGLGKPNIAISDRLDFMGDSNGRITTKEHDLITIMEDCYLSIEDWCKIQNKAKNEYCAFTNRNRFGIRSSSSFNEYVEN